MTTSGTYVPFSQKSSGEASNSDKSRRRGSVPFAGIGSEGFVSVQMGRKFVGVEPKDSYFRQARQNLVAAMRTTNDLFRSLQHANSTPKRPIHFIYSFAASIARDVSKTNYGNVRNESKTLAKTKRSATVQRKSYLTTKTRRAP